MWKYQEIQTRVCDKEREKTEKYDLFPDYGKQKRSL